MCIRDSLETANIITMSNLVDQPISDNDWETDSRPKVSGMDPNNAIYETKKIALEFTSNSLYVQLDGHREKGANIRAFYKLYRLDGNESTSYIPFNTNGLPDKDCLLYTSPSPRDLSTSRMPSSA